MFKFLKLANRVQALEERHDELGRQWKRMQMEWEDTYDKLRSVVQRVAKRAQRIEQLQTEAPTAEDEAPDVPETVGGFKLSAHQLEQQRRILARRARQ